MLKYFLLSASFFLILCICFSCQSQEDEILFIKGTYSGEFERSGESEKVELTFSKGKFEGSSERIKFPAICRGTYTLTSNQISFQNECAWTAEFDWTLILNGKWEYQNSVDQLILENDLGDRYILSKN